MLKESINSYYNSEDIKNIILNDDEYDILREHIIKKYPKNKIAINQHTEVKLDKTKVKLPYEMWSMTKIKSDTNEIEKFKLKFNGPYVISAKLDGVSALYSSENDNKKLYTRGNGIYGQNIDHLIKYLNLPDINDVTVRGELIIKENTFKEKYSNKFSNSRNFVSGMVIKKKITKEDEDILKDIDFVVYEVIKPNNLIPSEQLNKTIEYNFNCVKNIKNISNKELTNDLLSNRLEEWRESYEYTIDGIICIDDKIYERQSKNPEHAFAFKMIMKDGIVEAKVIDVIWTASKDGLLKPRIQLEPTTINGVTINYTTGKNAKFIVENKIGLGTIVKLKRSGEVIPEIVSIVKHSEEALMPNEKYKWNETNVDIIIENKEEDETVKLKNILGFFKILEVEGLGEGNIKKIMKTGKNSIGKIISMTKEDFLKVEGFKEKMSNKIYNSIKEKIDNSSIEKIAAASNIFGRGFGEKRIELILENEKDIKNNIESDDKKIEKLSKIDGLVKKTATNFVNKIKDFKLFLEESDLLYKLNKKSESKDSKDSKDSKENKNDVLSNEKIVLSDIKNKKIIEKKIKDLNGEILTSITKKVTLLIVNDLLTETTKSKKAKEYGIKIMTLEEFNLKYN
jgi:NAD-dependent DNA ligase